MVQQRRARLTPNEAKIQLAKSAFISGKSKSRRSAAKTYGASRSTLNNRMKGVPARADCRPNSIHLSTAEEKAIIDHAIDADERGYQLTYDILRETADKLLRDRGAPPVGINWPSRFVNRVKQLQTRVNRRYDYKRALNEDPECIRPWFELVWNVRNKHGIVDEDIYNFDECGFQMGKISPRMVITGSDRRYSPKSLQPGNTEWVTAIVAANATGWSIPPFIILKGAIHYDSWYCTRRSQIDQIGSYLLVKRAERLVNPVWSG